jgi:hypothetical protein
LSKKQALKRILSLPSAQEVYAPEKFCVETFSNPFELFFALTVGIFHTNKLPAVLPQLQETAQLECTDASVPSHSLPVQIF